MNRLPHRNYLAILTFVASAGSAQLPYMVADFTPGDDGGSNQSLIMLGAQGADAFIAADAATLGEELWATQGTPESTFLVADICPGFCSSRPRALGFAGGRFFFSALQDGYYNQTTIYSVLPSGLDLQVVVSETDGYRLAFLNQDSQLGYFAEIAGQAYILVMTSQGGEALLRATGRAGETVKVIDLGDSFDARFPYGFVSLTESTATFFFAAGLSGVIDQMWVTDGTAAGTHAIRDLGERASPGDAEKSGSRMYFISNVDFGSNLWISDGTTAGTVPLTSFSDPTARIPGFEVGASRTYFLVNSATSGEELWTTDGTPSGTHAATAFGFHAPFNSISSAEYFRQVVAITGIGASFIATDGIHPTQLWRTDGQPASTRPIADLCNEFGCADPWVETVGGRVLFAGASAAGIEPTLTDAAGTNPAVLKDVCPGPCSSLPFRPQLLPSGRALFFAYSSEPHYYPDLWITSGTAATTFNLLNPALPVPYIPAAALETTQRILFAGQTPSEGMRLWQSTGAAASATTVAAFSDVAQSSEPREFESVSDDLYFLVNSGSGGAFGRVSGATGTAALVGGNYHLCPGSYNPSHTALGSALIFFGCFGESIYRVDPGATEAALVTTIPTAQIRAAVALQSQILLFAAADDGFEVWRTDGTADGTVHRFDFPEGMELGYQTERIGDKAVLTAYDQESGPGLYAVGEQGSSLQLLTELRTSNTPLFVPDPSRGFFATLELDETLLWTTDATPAGTHPILTLEYGFGLLAAERLGAEYLLFVGRYDGPIFMVRTNGAPQGTAIVPGFESVWGAGIVATAEFEGAVYFTLPVDGQIALWESDGTSPGTHVVWTKPADADLDLQPQLAVGNAGLVFTGADAEHGTEPWLLPHRGAVPRLLHDIAPGPASSTPTNLFAHAGSVFFSANDGIHGQELWVVPAAGAEPCRASTLALCLEGGRFRVEAHWRDFDGNSGDATAQPISGDTGYFWFFDEANVEVIVKLIDGGGFNGHHWVYYGALTNVEYNFTVTDSVTGAAKRYFNPATRFASSGDITAFGPQGAHARGELVETMTQAATPLTVSVASDSLPRALPTLPVACVPSATRFCILNNRFAVTATWRDFHGNSGTANAGTLTDDTGYLWFFNEANVEVVVKMVDAGSFNHHFWVYFGALSNVEYTLTVTDTVAGGPPRIYHNALGKFGSFGDIEAFPAP